jgi:hypothetical protein
MMQFAIMAAQSGLVGFGLFCSLESGQGGAIAACVFLAWVLGAFK